MSELKMEDAPGPAAAGELYGTSYVVRDGEGLLLGFIETQLRCRQCGRDLLMVRHDGVSLGCVRSVSEGEELMRRFVTA